MTRALPEWIGSTDDAMPPPRVRLRIFQAHGGRCYRSGRAIRAGDKWALDHVLAIINGGENRERNLAPILEESHKEKNEEDMDTKSKTYRMARNDAGLKPKGRGWNTKLKRKMNGEVVAR